MYQRIQDGEFKNTATCMSKPSKPAVLRKRVEDLTDNDIANLAETKAQYEADMATYKASITAYNVGQAEADGRFREAALEDVGLAGHPKASKAYAMAWDRGHSGGLSEVYGELLDLADLLLNDD